MPLTTVDGIALPASVAVYFAAQGARDGNAFVGAFADDAVVRDEKRTHRGADAIRAWIEKASFAAGVCAEPLSMREDDGTMTVVARIAGTFPGSPIDLTHRFRLDENGSIMALEIG